MRYYEKDERVMANYYKATSHTLWAIWAILLIFGASIAVLEITDINAISIGILGT